MALQFEKRGSGNYRRILSEFYARVWAILPEKFATIESFLVLKASGGQVSKEEIALIKQPKREPFLVQLDPIQAAADRAFFRAQFEGAANGTPTKDGSTIAVLPLTGTICHRMGFLSEASGGISTERFAQWLRAAVADPSVKAIVIDADSPGGTVDGVPELADEIYRANQKKPLVGVANSMAASAAYWLLSQCSELCVIPSGSVGSIGVFASHEDLSQMYEDAGVKVSLVSAGKYKTEGNPYEPLSDEARAALQDQVNDFYNMFTKAVARGRKTDQASVKSGFGEGRMVVAAQAVKAGMADRVATLDQTLVRLGATGAKKPMAATGILSDVDLLSADLSNAPGEPQEHPPQADEMDTAANADWEQKLAARRRSLQLL